MAQRFLREPLEAGRFAEWCLSSFQSQIILPLSGPTDRATGSLGQRRVEHPDTMRLFTMLVVLILSPSCTNTPPAVRLEIS